jgi:hypothetical protein
MVDPAKGTELLARAKELAAKHGWQPKKRPPPKPPVPLVGRPLGAPAAAASARARVPRAGVAGAGEEEVAAGVLARNAERDTAFEEERATALEYGPSERPR